MKKAFHKKPTSGSKSHNDDEYVEFPSSWADYVVIDTPHGNFDYESLAMKGACPVCFAQIAIKARWDGERTQGAALDDCGVPVKKAVK